MNKHYEYKGVMDMNKTAVVYYSQTGQTRRVAERIAVKAGADLIEVIPEREYDSDMWKAADEAMEELKTGNLPEIRQLPDLSSYDTVLVGGPVWGMTISNPLLTFFRKTDLSGKTVSGFWTFYDHDEKYNRAMKDEAKGAHVIKGLSLPRSITGNPKKCDAVIDRWLDTLQVKAA